MKALKRILLIGGPGSGKSSLIHLLEAQGYNVHHEISREVILKAQERGIDQLFLTDPLAFSDQLLEGRIFQFNNATAGLNFYDRGIPDVPAYHIYTGDSIPDEYIAASKAHKYDLVFYMPPWETIYERDNERYETYEQAVIIGSTLVGFYKSLGYTPIYVPFIPLQERLDFIMNHALL